MLAIIENLKLDCEDFCRDSVEVTQITYGQLKIMRLLFGAGDREVKLKDVARLSRLTPPAASQIVDSLVHDGFLVRKSHPDDRRAVLIGLSERGRFLRQLHYDFFTKRTAEMLEKLSERERGNFLAALAKLNVSEEQSKELL